MPMIPVYRYHKELSASGAAPASDLDEVFDGIRAETAGDVKIQDMGGNDITMAIGTLETLTIAGKKVYATGTTAQGVTAHKFQEPFTT